MADPYAERRRQQEGARLVPFGGLGRPGAGLRSPPVARAREVECEDVGEWGGSYSYEGDYCYHFAELLKQNAKDGLKGKTWGGSSWELDPYGCGMHVEVDGEWYTVPADSMLDYLPMTSIIVPTYLKGKGCPIFVRMTPELQKALEKEVLGEAFRSKEELLNMEPIIVKGAVDELLLEWMKNKGGQAARYVEIHENAGWQEAMRFFIDVVIPEWQEDLDTQIDTREGFPVGWGFDVEGLHLISGDLEKIGRGVYVVVPKALSRYLLDTLKGRTRVSIDYSITRSLLGEG